MEKNSRGAWFPETKTHFTATLQLCTSASGMKRIHQQFVSNSVPTAVKGRVPASIIISDTYSLNVNWYLYQRTAAYYNLWPVPAMKEWRLDFFGVDEVLAIWVPLGNAEWLTILVRPRYRSLQYLKMYHSQIQPKQKEGYMVEHMPPTTTKPIPVWSEIIESESL